MSTLPHTNAFDLVLFDLDGTLVETAPEIMDAVNDTLRHFELPEVTQQQVNDWIGHGTRELLIAALAWVQRKQGEAVRIDPLLPTYLAAFDTYYQQRCGTRSHLYPQVRETLVKLRERGVKLAVVTNKEGRYTTVVLNSHQLLPLFNRVVSGDTMPNKKPDPAGILSCLAQFGVAPERALFVGDSSIDVATARNAGIAVWALPYGYNMGQPIEACAPDRVIADCSVLLKPEPMRMFAENLQQLPAITHLAALQLFNAAGELVATMENKPGKAGSLAVYAALAARHGCINVAAAHEGLALFAEHTDDARLHPGSHPNIDRLLEIIAAGHELSVKLVHANTPVIF